MANEFAAPGQTAGVGSPTAGEPAGPFFGGQFREISVPEVAVQNQTFAITGLFHLKSLLAPLTAFEARVHVDGPEFDTPFIFSFDDTLQHCNTRSFRMEIPTPVPAGQQFQVTVKGQALDEVSGWETGETVTRTMTAVSQGEQIVRQGVAFAPWVVGGGIAGFAAARQRPDLPRNLTTLGGAGVGALGKVTWDRVARNIREVSFPTFEVVAFTALLASGAFLVNEVTGIFEA